MLGAAHGGRREGAEPVGRRERAWCKRSRAGRELGVFKRLGQALRTGRGVFGWDLLGEALKRGQGLWWRQGPCCSQSVCDLLNATEGSRPLPPPLFFFSNVLIVPTVGSGRGTRSGGWRLGKGPLLCATGVYMRHECSRCGEGWERQEKSGLGNWSASFQLSASLSFFFFLHSIIAPFLGLSHERRCMCPGPPRKLRDRISQKESVTSRFSSRRLLLLLPRLYRLKCLIISYHSTLHLWLHSFWTI